MPRYAFYVDGFNMYFALDKKPAYKKYKWLSYDKLARHFIRAHDTIAGIYYFTAKVKWKPDNAKRHATYIKALESTGVKTVLGKFKNKDIQCHRCHRYFRTHEEKRTDVNIALQVVCDGMNDFYDRAVIISADSDLIPVFPMLKKYAPDKEIGVLLPIGGKSCDLAKRAHFKFNMTPERLREWQFPDTIQIGDTTISRPPSWK